VCTTDLDDVVPGISLILEGLVELLQSGDKEAVDLNSGSDVHGSGEAGKRIKKNLELNVNKALSELRIKPPYLSLED
jgi:hypothetical protein